MKLSIIVPAYNEEKYIEQCLKSLLNQQDKDFEMVVIDNNSKDKTNEIAKRYIKRVYVEKEKGYHNAVRRGVHETNGELIVICDSDTIYPRNWTRILKEEFSKDIKIVGVYGRVGFYDSDSILRPVQEKVYLLFMIVMKKLGIDVCNGYNFAFKRDAYLKVGGYDPKIYNLEGLDINLGIRLRKIGKLRLSKKLYAENSLRRVKKQGLSKFIITNLKFYYRLVTKKEIKRTYEEYNTNNK